MSEDIVFIGCGRITRALVQGLVAAGRPPHTLRGVSRTGAGARVLGAEFGMRVVARAEDAISGAGVVMLAVHPHEAVSALKDIAGAVSTDQLVVSLVASCHTDAVAEALPGPAVVRAVPNVAVAVRTGVTVLSAGPGAGSDELALAEAVFSAVGQVATVPEGMLETVSALSGAGPALTAYFVKALSAAGVAQGLPIATAEVLAAQAIRSTAALLAEEGTTPDDVIDAVASPGGMTEAALFALGERGVPGAVGHALDAAVRLSFGRRITAAAHPVGGS
ncbi:pyrroline-5-carboxylate reductase family protein [Streptomyces prunicolor]|uniref:Pyrroline-5-carboxylate reductase n=1 Tax=Streptomyces prunicolor TaxID=67348 RepID=A0ABU4FFK2_9ACTN|nr:pyrroline-5-carboxylate reductase dimerization domain-containing protein [Streptomyces prunicolor]MCX5243614.1 NAD(P)-binding domain-containing protein [Streptomyces prunicolor]MDV7219373.1 pyrroline-5-carboxylate reductase dimerization domain-containing protein [Streptomyces prunicolor]